MLLRGRLQTAIQRLNPMIPSDALEQALRMVLNFSLDGTVVMSMSGRSLRRGPSDPMPFTFG